MAIADAYRLQKMHATDPPEKAWKQFSPVFDLPPLRMANNVGAIENHSWIAGACIFAQVALDGNAHTHTEKHMESSGNLLFVHRYVAGGADGQSGAVPYMMRPGMLILHDYSRPFQGIQTPSLIQSLFVPHALVGYDPKTMPPQIMLDQKSPVGRALFAAFDDLIPDLLGGSDYMEKQRTREFTEMVRSALPEPDSEPHRQLKIQTFIEDKLKDPELDPGQVQDAFQLSRAQVYSEMEIYSGVANYIAVRRTYHALFDLVEKPEKRSDLEHVALEWGFESAAALSGSATKFYKADLGTLI